jgi:hypothetical protein
MAVAIQFANAEQGAGAEPSGPATQAEAARGMGAKRGPRGTHFRPPNSEVPRGCGRAPVRAACTELIPLVPGP